MTPIPKTSASSHRIRASNLTPDAFAPFGTVIQNPATHANQPSHLTQTTANQGTATKWLDVTQMRNWYDMSASRKPANVAMNMFVCRPRQLREDLKDSANSNSTTSSSRKHLFDVQILERHPFTPQTFIPLSLSSSPSAERKYLVIVAPTLPLRSRSSSEHPQPPYPTPPPRPQRHRRRSLRQRLLGARPNPFTNDHEPSTTPPPSSSTNPQSYRMAEGTEKPKGPGGPDLANLRAFIARGDQAVTYGPGTWHAPMVVLGEEEVEFVVVQFANGVGVEDCQEIEVVAEKTSSGQLEEGVVVEVDAFGAGERGFKAKL